MHRRVILLLAMAGIVLILAAAGLDARSFHVRDQPAYPECGTRSHAAGGDQGRAIHGITN